METVEMMMMVLRFIVHVPAFHVLEYCLATEITESFEKTHFLCGLCGKETFARDL